MNPPKRSYRNLIVIAGLIVGFIGLSALLPVDNTITKTNLTSPTLPSEVAPNDFDALASAATQFGPAVTKGRKLSTSDMTNPKPLIPSDIYRPGGAQGPAHEDLATFAWLEFISLASLKGSVRGETGGSFEDSGNKGNATLVWESYQHRAELFPYVPGSKAGRPPAPWDQAPDYKMFYTDKSGKQQQVKIPYSNFNNLDETTQIGMNILYFPIDPSVMKPDSDFEVLFEAKVNQMEWSFVNDNYKKFADFNTHFKDGIDLPDGTIEVKATWRPLSSIKAEHQYRYHTTSAIWYKGEDDNPEADVHTYALIGLHIIHKTPNFPAFIFATFEHMDNLKNPDGSKSGLYYVPTYDKITYSLPAKTTTSNPTETIENPSYPSDWLNDPYAMPSSGKKIPLAHGSVADIDGAKILKTSIGNVVGVPVTQPPTTNNAVSQVNGEALAAMKKLPTYSKNFVWQYYFLKGVQGVPSDDEQSPDYYLANIVTESSVPGIQLFAGGQGITDKVLEIPRNQANTRDKKQVMPTVTKLPSNTKITIPSGLKVTCLSDPNSLDLSSTCPVVKWNGLTIWALSYIDNRNSMALVAYDAFGKVVGQLELSGSRYVYKITVDDAAKKVNFVGQSNQTVSATYDQLEFGQSARIVFNQGGCQGCHGIAQTGSGFDFSFLYFNRTSGFSPEVHGLTSAELTKAKSDKYRKMLNLNAVN